MKAWKVSIDEDVWPEPSLLHCEVNIVGLENRVETVNAGSGEHQVRVAISIQRSVLGTILQGIQVLTKKEQELEEDFAMNDLLVFLDWS